MITEGNVGLLFVQSSKVEELKAKGVDSRFEVTLCITEDFMYGPQNSWDSQLLIYHDKSNKIYQVKTSSQTVPRFKSETRLTGR
jgi:hypothetical protein